MKRKLFTFLVAFLATLSGAVWGQKLVTGDSAPIVVEDGYEGTITLENATITADGAAITVPASANPVFVIKGKNKIDTNGGVAIKTPRGTNNTAIEFRGGGLLEINSTATDFISIGVVSGEYRGLTFQNVTIQTNGKIGGQQAVVNLENAVIIADEIPAPSVTKNFSGVVFTKGKTKADMTASFTLNSPLPEGYVINLNHKLTIGEGNSINKNQVKDDLQNLNAYEVKYESQFTDDKFPLPANNKYYGPGYTLASWNAGFEQQMPTNGNKKDDKLFYAHTEKTGWILGDEYCAPNSIQKAGEIPSNFESLTYQAAWYLREANLKYDTDGYKGKEFPLGYPVNAGITATTGNTTELSSAGLQIKDENVSSTDKGATAGTHEIELAYNSPLNNAKGQIVVNVEGKEFNLNDENIQIDINSPVIYNGDNQKVNLKVSYVKDGNTIEFDPTEYTLTYKQVMEWVPLPEQGFKNVGTYRIKIDGDAAEGRLKGTREVEFIIKKATLTIKGGDNLYWTIGGEPQLLADKFYLDGICGSDGNFLTVTADRVDAQALSGGKEGDYSLDYQNVKIDDQGRGILHNYNYSTDVSGILHVKKAPVTASDFNIAMETEFTYSGISNAIALSVVYGEDNKVADPTWYKATFYQDIGNDQWAEVAAPIDAGTYKVEVTGDGTNLVAETEAVEFVINKKPLFVAAEDVVCKLGEDPKKTVAFVITNGLVSSDRTQVFVENQTLDVSTMTPGIHENHVYENVVLIGSRAGNYYIAGSVKGKVSIEEPKPEPSDPEIEVPDGWTLTANGFKKVYDGQSYKLQTLKVTVDDRTFTMKEGVDFTLERQGADKGQIIKDAGVYTFTVKFTDAALYKPAPITFTVLQRPMYMAFNVPTQIETLAPIAIQADHLMPEAQKGDRGLVNRMQKTNVL